MNYTQEYPTYQSQPQQPSQGRTWAGRVFSVLGCGLVVVAALVVVVAVFALGAYHKVQNGYGDATRTLDDSEYIWTQKTCEIRASEDALGRPKAVAYVDGLFAHNVQGETRKTRMTFVITQEGIQISESAWITTPDLTENREYRAAGEISVPAGTTGPIGCEITEAAFTL